MDSLFRQFGVAQSDGNGIQLAETLSPELDPQRLEAIWSSASFNDAKNVIKRKLQKNAPPMGLPADEVNGWVEVYYAYWKSVGKLLSVKDDVAKGQVRFHRSLFLLTPYEPPGHHIRTLVHKRRQPGNHG